MFNLALVGLLAGSLAFGPTGDDDKKKKAAADDAPAVENATPGVFETGVQGPQTVTADTYALGFPSDASPIKFWASYAYGQADGTFDTSGETAPLTVARSEGQIISQRINVGAQINAISFPSFKLGAGALFTVAKNEFQVSDTPNSPFANPVGDLESTFGPQGLKVYGAARGKVLGVHGGYIFDFGDARGFDNNVQATVDFTGTPLAPFGVAPVSFNANAPADQQVLPTAFVALNSLPGYQAIILPESISNSDGRDAITFGVDFDYPSERFRLFGGADYFALQGIEDEPATIQDESELDGDDLVNFMLGGGVRFGVVEVGAAFQIQTRLDNPTVQDIGTEEGIGGHATTLAPYVRISPASLPATIFVKGAVQEEYTEYGLGLAGANSVKPQIGFTAGLSIGFE